MPISQLFATYCCLYLTEVDISYFQIKIEEYYLCLLQVGTSKLLPLHCCIIWNIYLTTILDFH